MKIKQTLYINNPEAHYRDPKDGLVIVNGNYMDDDWINCGEIEVDVDIDRQLLIDKTVAEINKELGKAQEAINRLEARKADMLALTHSPATPTGHDYFETREQ